MQVCFVIAWSGHPINFREIVEAMWVPSDVCSVRRRNLAGLLDLLLWMRLILSGLVGHG